MLLSPVAKASEDFSLLLLCDPALLATTAARGIRRRADALGRASPSPTTVLLKDSMLSRGSPVVLAEVVFGLLQVLQQGQSYLKASKKLTESTRSQSAALVWAIASSQTGAADRLRQAFSICPTLHHLQNAPSGSLGASE